MHSYLEKRCRPHLRPTNDSWRVDETYIEVKGKQKYLCRAVDSTGQTLDFLLSALARCPSCPPVFPQGIESCSQFPPRVINVDKNQRLPKAINELKAKKELPKRVELRQNKYLNNRVEQDHRFIKRLVKPGMGCGLVQHGATNDKGL